MPSLPSRTKRRRRPSILWIIITLAILLLAGSYRIVGADEDFYDAACTEENGQECTALWANNDEDNDVFHDAHDCDPAVDKHCGGLSNANEYYDSGRHADESMWSFGGVPDGIASDVSSDGSVSSEDSLWSFGDDSDIPPPPKEAPPQLNGDEDEAFPEFPPWIGKKTVEEDPMYQEKKKGGGVYSYFFGGEKETEEPETKEEWGMDNIPPWSTFG